VVGSRIEYEDHDPVVARTVTRDNQTVAFRKLNGRPLWAE
jgi:hypothetical protein